MGAALPVVEGLAGPVRRFMDEHRQRLAAAGVEVREGMVSNEIQGERAPSSG